MIPLLVKDITLATSPIWMLVVVPLHTMTWQRATFYALSYAEFTLSGMGTYGELPERRKHHSTEFLAVRSSWSSDVGTHSAKPIEDCMKAYFNDHRNNVRRSRGTLQRGGLWNPMKADVRQYTERFQA
jgi:hypothetical protein